MSSLRLITLKLRNFKGIQSFVLDTRGGNTQVFGDNATGKTSLFDASNWLLFDKDSENRKDFGIKTLDPSGQPIHHLEHEVEGTFEFGGRTLTLRKVFTEKWTKKRGSAQDEFTGHETQHFVDGVPVAKSEYGVAVSRIADEATFRLVTDPGYFNSDAMHWTKRRKVLLEVCGDVTDREVIASDAALSGLPRILGDRPLEDHRKVLQVRRTEINKELERIPVRIDEATRGLPDAGGDRSAIQAELARLREQRQVKAGEQVRIQAGGETAEKQKRIREIDIEILGIEQRLRQSADQAAQQERSKLAAVSDQVDAKRREINRLNGEIQDGDREIETLKARLDKLRAEWRQINALGPPADNQDETCPTCGQDIPAAQVQEARDKAVAEYNARKSSLLEQNNAEGKRQKARLDEVTEANTARLSALAQAETTLATLRVQVAEIQDRIDYLRHQTPDATQDPEYRRLNAEKAKIELEIAGLRNGNTAALEQVAQAIGALDQQIATLESTIGRHDQRESGILRIKELKAEERKLAGEFEKLEQELHLTEEFIRAKVRLLTDKINNRFRYARFKLFEQQVNGALAEVCETTYGGVPYSDLNNGARINVGLDIINTLSEHYQFEAPIWIDNREAVTRLIPTRAQIISLVVSEPDKKLRIEHEAAKQLTLEAV